MNEKEVKEEIMRNELLAKIISSQQQALKKYKEEFLTIDLEIKEDETINSSVKNDDNLTLNETNRNPKTKATPKSLVFKGELKKKLGTIDKT